MPLTGDEVRQLRTCAAQLEAAGLQLASEVPDLRRAGEALLQAAMALRGLHEDFGGR